MDLPSHPAPHDRVPLADLKTLRDLVTSHGELTGLLTSLRAVVAILNPQRQIVFATPAFEELRASAGHPEVLGLRPGEALGCIHASDAPGGCGTSESCALCGAVQSIQKSQDQGARVVQECRLTLRRPQGYTMVDFEVASLPWVLGGQTFTVVTVRDLGAEKRIQFLEKTFFHDIVNTAGGLNGVLDLLAQHTDLNQGRNLLDIGLRSSQDLLEELLAFRQLKQAEAGDLVAVFEPLDPTLIVREAVDKIRYHRVAEGRSLVQGVEPDLPPVLGDRLILERILMNMLKNGLEAVPVGAEVRIGGHREGDQTVFTVRNPGTMARDVQLQVFQRSFSTKRPDRGMGTYSMRLLGENYLGGRVELRVTPVEVEFRISLPSGH